MKKKFEYGEYIIEYRKVENGFLSFLQKKINDIDTALKESQKLKDLGYHDVLIKRNQSPTPSWGWVSESRSIYEIQK